ncbi:hypothetical protein FISHEDRAFT_37122 [Fistulina hepatica ATCC 64428]|uniref:Uncharacterized protein n=1 Tax=Fistulina hepatica ATCC 64428 TaxID=1128425 RepID=A0A0D7AHT7_9AGAR|nr:hypothetical protein FISHEDRAFT_37122 [Fistulina hepatica ATCC 64428]
MLRDPLAEFVKVYVDISYDAACQFSKNWLKRIREEYPDLVSFAESARVRWVIPAMHVEGHTEDCTYQYGTCYKECCGHFHGETAEHFWPTLNQFCKVTRQMTAGHRHDALTMFTNAWNWKKVSSLGRFHITCPNDLLA